MPLYRTPGQYGGSPQNGSISILQHELVAGDGQSSITVAGASSVINVFRQGQALIAGETYDYTVTTSGSGVEIELADPLIAGELVKVDYLA
jgi:hypothetical protein